MSMLRELAYQIDPVLWVRKVLGVEPTPGRNGFLRAPHGSSDHRPDRAAGRQDHGRGMGDRASHAVFAGQLERDRLSWQDRAGKRCGGCARS